MTVRITWPPMVERFLHAVMIVGVLMALWLVGIMVLGLDAHAIVYGSASLLAPLWAIRMEVERE